MTVLFGRKGDSEPFCCGVCGRQASSFGYMGNSANHKSPIMWLCEDATCLKVARDVYTMRQDKLSEYERMAISAATDTAVPSLFEAFIGILWDGGVRDLGKLDGEAVKKFEIAAKQSNEVKAHLETFLRTYAGGIKQCVLDNEIPY